MQRMLAASAVRTLRVRIFHRLGPITLQLLFFVLVRMMLVMLMRVRVRHRIMGVLVGMLHVLGRPVIMRVLVVALSMRMLMGVGHFVMFVSVRMISHGRPPSSPNIKPNGDGLCKPDRGRLANPGAADSPSPTAYAACQLSRFAVTTDVMAARPYLSASSKANFPR